MYPFGSDYMFSVFEEGSTRTSTPEKVAKKRKPNAFEGSNNKDAEVYANEALNQEKKKKNKKAANTIFNDNKNQTNSTSETTTEEASEITNNSDNNNATSH